MASFIELNNRLQKHPPVMQEPHGSIVSGHAKVTAGRWLLASAALLAASLAAGQALAQAKTASTDANSPFVFGTLLPLTGPAALFGPGMSAAVDLAVKDINEAGGVLGRKVTLVKGDDAGDPSFASQTLDRLLSQGAQVIMGTGSTSVTLSLLDKVVRARAAMCSGANTGLELTAYPKQGYYFRTSYSNALQGPVLAQLALGDGHTRVALLGRGDAFGRGLVGAAETALKEAGAEISATVIYDPQQTSFDAEVQKIVASKPDGVILIGYDERGKIFRGMIERGLGPKKIGIYTTGVLSADFWKSVNPADPASIEGVKQTAAPLMSKGDFSTRLAALQPGLKSFQFAPEQYDCAIIAALGMVAAKSTDPSIFKSKLASVTTGSTECNSYKDCADKLDSGKSIAYVGPTGPLKLNAAGDPTMARFQIYVVDAKGQSQPVRQIQVGGR